MKNQELVQEKPKEIKIQTSGSIAVIDALLSEKVTTVFGYPGGAIMPIYDALYDFKEKINHILVRHEQGAIHAAHRHHSVLQASGLDWQ